jgi:predicted DNA-binding antitoxin AbrB/MazE fold protein
MGKTIEAIYENGVFKPERKLRMKEHQKVRIQILPDDDWKERFDKALKSIRSKAAQFTQEEIERDIEEAIKEVRAERRVRESRS